MYFGLKYGGRKMKYLEKFATFYKTAELDAALAEHLERNKFSLNETERSVIMYIGRMACKFPGAMSNKNETIAQAIGRSVTQVRRILKKLEDLGIIRRVAMIRPKRKGNGANVIQILPPKKMIAASEETKEESIQEVIYEPTPQKGAVVFKRARKFKMTMIKAINNKTQEPLANSATSNGQAPMDTRPVSKELTPTTGLKHNLEKDSLNSLHKTPLKPIHKDIKNTYSTQYGQFLNWVEIFIGDEDRKLINRLYGAYLGITKRAGGILINVLGQDLLDQTAYRALHYTFQRSKNIKIKNLVGYFSIVFNKQLDNLYFS